MDNTQIQKIIVEAAKEFYLAPELLLAIAKAESDFKPGAFNEHSGAQGMFQFIDTTFAWVVREIKPPLKTEDPYCVRSAARAAAWYVRFLIDLFKGDELLAIASYNWGQGNVLKYAKPFLWYGHRFKSDIVLKLPSETFHYVRRVTKYKREFAYNPIT